MSAILSRGARLRFAKIEPKLASVVADGHPIHPFRKGVTSHNARHVLAHYLAMSVAFPYLQAGAQQRLIQACIDENRDVRPEEELTTVVGNFLTADETGVNYVLGRHGISGLPQLLDTDSYFHSNLLRADLRAIFGQDVAPQFDGATAQYLRRLSDDLADPDDVKRCAAMVAFEAHAERMIEALWERLVELFPLDKDQLVYFRIHVGCDDPAEVHHVAMTSRMIEQVVPEEEEAAFLQAFERAYSRNIDWCEALTQR
jgi:hypothetical protein